MVGKEQNKNMSESLEKFTSIAKEDHQRAKTLFFSEAFKEEFLKDKQKEKQLYHQLLLGRNRDQILEEFLLSTDQKSPVLLDVTKTTYHATIANLDEPLEITIRKDGWGYIAGRVKTEGKFITLHKDTFHAEDFEDGQMTIYVDLKTIPRDGDRDHLIVQTVYQTIEIEVIYKEEKSERKKEEEFRQKKLYELYIDFCSGRIRLEQFAERARSVLDKMPDHPVRNRIYDLMKLHLDILCGKEDLKEHIPEDAKKESLEICQGYVWYLQACYDKEDDTIDEAREEMKILYENSDDINVKGYLFWFLMNLSEDLMKDSALRMKQIKELYQEGCQNPLLRFEGCCILGEDEQLLTCIDSYELWVLEFGAQEKILNTRLIGKLCFLVSRNKIFSEEILWLFMCIYKEYPQTDVLQAICAMMIQGNCMDEDCHPYYEEALQRGVQLIGLQEAFLRTIPKGEYPLLPEEILMYFTYSMSLGAEEQSRLFANVVHNRRNYHKIFPNYEELIRTFLREELQKGQINEDLILLYRYYYEELLQDEVSRQNLGNVVFVQKLICDNEFIQKAEISQEWKKNLDVCYLSEPNRYVEIFDQNAAFIFFDNEGNRYIGSVAYQLKPVFTREQMEMYCESANGNNPHYVMYKAAGFGIREKLKEEDFPVVLYALKSRNLDVDYEQELFEKVLEYYKAHELQKELQNALSYVEWKNLKDENRRHMIGYFIAAGLYEDALKGIGQYGYQFLDKDQLKEVCLYALTTLSNRRSDLLVEMCMESFELGNENNEVIKYLQKYFHGTKEEMLAVFDAGQKVSMYDRVFVESVLRACIADGVDGTEFKVFEEYLNQSETDKGLINAMLVEYVNYAYDNKQELPEKFYELIGEKIDHGKMDWMYQQLYLDYYKDKKEQLSERSLKRIEKIKDYQIIRRDHILPVLFEYVDVISLPKYLCAETFVQFYAKSSANVVFHYMDSDNGHWIEEPMNELLPGYYVLSLAVFYHELSDCYVSVSGELRRYREDVIISDHMKYSKGSRFYELNELLIHQQDEDVQKMMERYAVKTMMTQMVKPMTEE